MHAHEMYAHEMQAREVHLHETHARETHAREIHAHEVHASEMIVSGLHRHRRYRRFLPTRVWPERVGTLPASVVSIANTVVATLSPIDTRHTNMTESPFSHKIKARRGFGWRFSDRGGF
jgi:hypothetical protein